MMINPEICDVIGKGGSVILGDDRRNWCQDRHFG